MEYRAKVDVMNNKYFFAADVKGSNYRLPYSMKRNTYVFREDT